MGCAFVIPELHIKQKFRLNDNVSIFTAEITAISQALDLLESQPDIATKIVILSDSKSALQALSRPGKNSRYFTQMPSIYK